MAAMKCLLGTPAFFSSCPKRPALLQEQIGPSSTHLLAGDGGMCSCCMAAMTCPQGAPASCTWLAGCLSTLLSLFRSEWTTHQCRCCCSCYCFSLFKIGKSITAIWSSQHALLPSETCIAGRVGSLDELAAHGLVRYAQCKE